MKNRNRILLAGLLVAMLSGLAWEVLRQREPTYEGRPVTAWMRDGYLNGTSPNESELNRLMKPKAIEAVIAIGTNALPYYVDLLRTRDDSPLKARFCRWLNQQHWHKFDFTDTWPYSSRIRRAYGGCGINILGADAKTAIPALAQLLNEEDEDQVTCVAFTLPAIGLEGIQPLTNVLANSHAKWRDISAAALRFYAKRDNFFVQQQQQPRTQEEIEAAAKIIVPVLIPYLKDGDPLVQLNVIDVLGAFGKEPDIIVPIIIEIFQKNRKSPQAFEDVCITALAGFGPKAKAAVPVLLELLKDPDPNIRQLAADAIKAIDSSAAAKAGVK